jgi:hypothetical protein
MKMTEPITEFDDAFFGFYEYATGNIYLRFKEGVTRDTSMSPRLEKMKKMIPENHPTTNEQKDLSAA